MCQKANSKLVQTLFILRRKPGQFLDETDVDSYFYYNNFDISQSQLQIVPVSRGSNKKSFAIKLFAVLLFKDTATSYPPRRSE